MSPMVIWDNLLKAWWLFLLQSAAASCPAPQARSGVCCVRCCNDTQWDVTLALITYFSVGSWALWTPKGGLYCIFLKEMFPEIEEWDEYHISLLLFLKSKGKPLKMLLMLFPVNTQACWWDGPKEKLSSVKQHCSVGNFLYENLPKQGQEHRD